MTKRQQLFLSLVLFAAAGLFMFLGDWFASFEAWHWWRDPAKRWSWLCSGLALVACIVAFVEAIQPATVDAATDEEPSDD